MYIRDGIVYAGNPKPMPRVCSVRPLENHKLWLRFNTDEEKIFDCKPLLTHGVFAQLRDDAFFRTVYLDYGTVVWNDGNIDIAPEHLYEYGVSAQ